MLCCWTKIQSHANEKKDRSVWQKCKDCKERSEQLFKQNVSSARDGVRARALKHHLEANARWNAERRDAAASVFRRIVHETSTINSETRKELLYSWEKGFIKDKLEWSTKDRSAVCIHTTACLNSSISRQLPYYPIKIKMRKQVYKINSFSLFISSLSRV